MGKTNKNNSKKDKPDKSEQKTENKVVKKVPTSILKKKRIQSREPFACQWKNCMSTFVKGDELYDHVKQHLPQVEIVDGELIWF